MADHTDAPQVRRYLEEIDYRNCDEVTLLCHAAGWKQDTAKYQALHLEILRREKVKERGIAWVAIGVSLLSLAISGMTLFSQLAGRIN